MPFGYHGRILRVDLGDGSSRFEDLDEEVYRLYAGGSLLATRLLMTETAPGLDPLGPDALLVFASSVVAGQRAAALPRFSVVARSPLTGGIGETRAEGPFGVALKESGADAIVIRGAAASPVYLLVEDSGVQLLPAAELWGLETGAATERLQATHPGAHVAVIGPAGERQVRFASIVTDRSFQAPRMGLGAVMGAKRLKAMVLRGGAPVAVADPEGLDSLTRWYDDAQQESPVASWQHRPPGFGAWVEGAPEGTFAVENYRTSRFPERSGFAADVFLSALAWSEDGCPGCPNDCIKGFVGGMANDTARAKARRLRTGGLHQEAAGALGPNLGLLDARVVLALNQRCLELGLDPASLGSVLGFAMECRENGLLPGSPGGRTGQSGLDGLDLRFGADGSVLLEAVERIARREGVGDALAEGVARASHQLGAATEGFALHVKGLEMVCFEPRTSTNLALGYATAPIGPRYDIVEHDADYDLQPSWPHALDRSRTLGITRLKPMEQLLPEKVPDFKALSDFWSGLDALLVCPYASAPVRVLTLEGISRLVAMVTGWDTSSYELMRWGARRNQLLRLYDLREGLTAADDTLPDRFFDEPVDAGRFAGVRLDRARFAEMRALYYASMGWDDAGVPTKATRYDHHLEWTLESEGDEP
jgi:aldehyde:ferredoxin oxidoreductase